jgi:putative phosphoesterase
MAFGMRIGLISDIHGNDAALKAVLGALQDRVELILFMGDLAGYYPFVDECVCQWDRSRMLGVLGNHDWILLECIAHGGFPSASYCAKYGSALTRSLSRLSHEARCLIESWPQHRCLELEGTSVAMFHGAPWNPLEGRVYPDFEDWDRFSSRSEEVILLGHTHYPIVKKWDGKIIINPGSVGQPRLSSGAAEFATLELPQQRVELQRVQYDPSAVIRDARCHDPELGYLVEVLTR